MDLWASIASVFEDFADPKKRVFVGYLFLSLLIALAWLVFIRRHAWRQALRETLDRRVFLSASAIADYKIFVINRLFSFLISPLLITQLAIATAIYYALHEQGLIRPNQFAGMPTWGVVALFSGTMFMVDDLTKYLLHRWMHRFPLLWALHKTHHSATSLTPVTVYRVHPLEGILYGLRSTFAQGVVMSVFVYLFGDKVDLYTVLGVNVLVFVFHITGSNLRHTHVAISYWPWLEHILISPAQHQIHHSLAEEHYDKNFGAALAVWDWLFGSLHLSRADQELRFGLDESQNSAVSDLTRIYLDPFLDMGRVVRRRWRRVKRRLTRASEPQAVGKDSA